MISETGTTSFLNVHIPHVSHLHNFDFIFKQINFRVQDNCDFKLTFKFKLLIMHRSRCRYAISGQCS